MSSCGLIELEEVVVVFEIVEMVDLMVALEEVVVLLVVAVQHSLLV